MALLNDGPINDPADLQRYENGILNIVSVEGIDVGSKITLAQQDVSNEVLLFLQRRMTLDDQVFGLRQFRGVDDVAVTESLRQWHVYKTLAFVYRDAYNNILNDRYKAKWNEYETLTKAGRATYFKIGVGLVSDPIPKAAAPALTAIAGLGRGALYYVATTWTNVRGEEGAPSDFSQLTTLDSEQLSITTSGMPRNVVGWNVYVGTSPGDASRQNDEPLAISGSWTVSSGLNAGTSLPSGQQPTCFIVDQHVVERG